MYMYVSTGTYNSFFSQEKRTNCLINRILKDFIQFDCKRHSFINMFAHFALTTMFI